MQPTLLGEGGPVIWLILVAAASAAAEIVNIVTEDGK